MVTYCRAGCTACDSGAEPGERGGGGGGRPAPGGGGVDMCIPKVQQVNFEVCLFLNIQKRRGFKLWLISLEYVILNFYAGLCQSLSWFSPQSFLSPNYGGPDGQNTTDYQKKYDILHNTTTVCYKVVVLFCEMLFI